MGDFGAALLSDCGGINMLELIEQIQKDNRINSCPVNFDKVCKKYRLKVIHKDFSEIEEKTGAKINGMIMYDDKQRRGEIYVNALQPETEQYFMVAHELGHYFLHLPHIEDLHCVCFRGLIKPAEEKADKFASELIMPNVDVVKAYESCIFCPTLGFLSRKFSVPRAAMQKKREDLRLEVLY